MAIDQGGPEPVPVGQLSVGQLASRAGVRVDTVRFYERTGLLPRPRRTGGDHRRYGPADVDRLDSFIKVLSKMEASSPWILKT